MSKYRTIVADPPWHLRTPAGWNTNTTRDALPYERMSLDAIKLLPVEGWAEDNAHLYLWTVNRYVEESYGVVRAWGFEPKALLTWCKSPGRMMGGVFASTTEFVVFARRGVDGVRGCRHPTSWWEWPRGTHSAKPDAFFDIVEDVSPGPYLEMFARRARFGWSYWGNQSLETAEIGEAA